MMHWSEPLEPAKIRASGARKEKTRCAREAFCRAPLVAGQPPGRRLIIKAARVLDFDLPVGNAISGMEVRAA